MEYLPIDSIRIDLTAQTQARVSMSQDHIDQIAEFLGANKKNDTDPIDVFNDGEHNYLADGFHRRPAYLSAGRDKIPVNIHQGTLRDAILFAVGANAQHNALRRTNADKRRAVTILLQDKEWSANSTKWIADHCHVSPALVSDIRDEMTRESSSASRKTQGKELYPETRTGKDGKTYHARKACCAACKRRERVGQEVPKHCHDCAVLQKQGQEREPGEDESYTANAREQSAKNGQVVFDFRKVDEPLGRLVRAVEECGHAYGRGASYETLDGLLAEFSTEWTAAKKRLQKS